MHESMLMLSTRQPARLSILSDSVGAIGAAVCAVHCALLPLALALLPALGAGMLASAGFEYGYVAFASVLVATSLWQGYRRHRAYRALVFLAPGILSVWAGMLMHTAHENVVLHAVVMTFGGTLIAVAHLVNLSLSHGHVHDSICAHRQSAAPGQSLPKTGVSPST